jgi:peptidoglycan biosynthesis protein MviN/MurJ (putative lipid II flippase)
MSRVAIASRIRNAHPDHHAIARGMLVGAAFIFVSKIAGAAKEMAIAWRYGVSEVVDAYLFIFNLVNWPVAVWFAILVVVLVPLAATIRERAPVELPRFRGEILGFTLLLGLSLALLAEIGLQLFLRSSLSGLSGPALSEALKITPVLCCFVLFGMPISLLSAWTTAAGRHANTLLEGVPALTIFVVLLLISGSGSTPLVWGTVAGLMFQLISLSFALMSRRELEVPRLSLHSPYWGAFWKGFGIMLVGQALLSLTSVVDQLFAARLAPGAIATLSYANRIVALVLGLGATAVSRATLPVFSQARAIGSRQVGHVAMRWAQLLFGLGVLAFGVGWWLAPWSVRIIFERGAFTARDTQAVTEVLRYALVQVPFYVSSLVFVSLVSSNHSYKVLSLSGLTGLIVKVITNVVLIPWIGLNGLVLANAFVYAFNLTFLLVVMKSGKLQNPGPPLHAT